MSADAIDATDLLDIQGNNLESMSSLLVVSRPLQQSDF